MVHPCWKGQGSPTDTEGVPKALFQPQTDANLSTLQNTAFLTKPFMLMLLDTLSTWLSSLCLLCCELTSCGQVYPV